MLGSFYAEDIFIVPFSDLLVVSVPGKSARRLEHTKMNFVPYLDRSVQFDETEVPKRTGDMIVTER